MKRRARRRRPVVERGLWRVFAAFGATLAFLAWHVLAGRSRSVVPSFQTATYPWAAQPRGLVFTWPQSDQAESSYPWAALAGRMWRSGHLPLWDPLSFGGGSPLATDGVSATLYPVRALLDASLPAWVAHEALVLVHLAAAGFGLYWLVRRWGASRAAACLAGIAWMTNAYVWSWAPLEMVVPFFAALPLVLAAFDSAIRSKGRWRVALAAVVLALALVSCNIAYAVVVANCGALYLAGASLTKLGRRARNWRDLVVAAIRSGVVIVTGLALSGAVLLPTLVNLSQISRKPFTFDVLRTSLLASWDSYARVLTKPASPPTAEQLATQFYLTPVVLVLALVGLLFARRGGAWAARLLIAVPVLLATTVPGAWLAYHLLPGLNAVHPYGRLLPISLMGACALAGLGMDVLLSCGHMLLQKRAALVAAAARLLVVTALLGGVLVPSYLVSRSLEPPPATVSDFPEFPATPLIAAIRRTERSAHAPSRILPATASYTTVPASTSPPTFVGGTALVPGIGTWGGYDSAVPQRTSQLVQLVTGADPQQVLSSAPGPDIVHPIFFTGDVDWGLACRLGTDLVAVAPTPPAGVSETWGNLPRRDLREKYSGPDGRLYALPRRCASRAYLASASVRADSDTAAISMLGAQGQQALAARHGQPADRVVVVPSDEKVPTTSLVGADSHPGSVHFTSREGSDLSVRARTSSSMWLVLPLSYDPGWAVQVNGEPVNTYRVDFNRLAVQVGSGRSEVDASFRPVRWNWGLLSSGVGLILVIAIAAPVRARRQRPAAADGTDVVRDGEGQFGGESGRSGPS